jgi:hypothetical protein
MMSSPQATHAPPPVRSPEIPQVKYFLANLEHGKVWVEGRLALGKLGKT